MKYRHAQNGVCIKFSVDIRHYLGSILHPAFKAAEEIHLAEVEALRLREHEVEQGRAADADELDKAPCAPSHVSSLATQVEPAF